MFRLWGRLVKNNRVQRDTVVCNADYSMTRTAMVLDALDRICMEFDLEHPIWLDRTVEEFKQRSRTRFTGDSFIEEHDFDYLEIQVLEE